MSKRDGIQRLAERTARQQARIQSRREAQLNAETPAEAQAAMGRKTSNRQRAYEAEKKWRETAQHFRSRRRAETINRLSKPKPLRHRTGDEDPYGAQGTRKRSPGAKNLRRPAIIPLSEERIGVLAERAARARKRAQEELPPPPPAEEVRDAEAQLADALLAMVDPEADPGAGEPPLLVDRADLEEFYLRLKPERPREEDGDDYLEKWNAAVRAWHKCGDLWAACDEKARRAAVAAEAEREHATFVERFIAFEQVYLRAMEQAKEIDESKASSRQLKSLSGWLTKLDGNGQEEGAGRDPPQEPEGAAGAGEAAGAAGADDEAAGDEDDDDDEDAPLERQAPAKKKARQTSIIGFFDKKENPERAQIITKRWYEEYYHDVYLQDPSAEPPDFKSSGAFAEISTGRNTVAYHRHAPVDNASRTRLRGDCTSDACNKCGGTSLREDAKSGYVTCTSCGTVLDTRDRYRATWADMQAASTRSAAPYQRVSHVSSLLSQLSPRVLLSPSKDRESRRARLARSLPSWARVDDPSSASLFARSSSACRRAPPTSSSSRRL